MESRLKYLLAVLPLFAVMTLTFNTHGKSTKGQQPISVTLQSSGSVLESSRPLSAISSSEDDQALYLADGITGDVEAYSDEPNNSFRSLGKATGLITGPGGYTARIDKDLKVTVSDAAGNLFARFATYPTVSLAFLNNGNIIVASPINGRLLHVYRPTGHLVRSFGAVKEYDKTNDMQNRFLHRGKVLVDADGNIYYVYHYIPLIQKFSPNGTLDYEMEVKGGSIDLQQELALRFFSIKDRQQVGGVEIITSASIDRKTGHLWVSMNGSTLAAVVYEYSSRGEKLCEYSLEVNSAEDYQSKILGVKDIAVTNSKLHVLTSQNQVHSFDRSYGSVARVSRAKLAQSPRLTIKPVVWSPTIGNSVLRAQASCGTGQTWNSCTFTCPSLACSNGQPTTTSSNGSLQNCKDALSSTLSPGYTVVSSSCTQFPAGTAMHARGGCRSEVTICREGVNSNHSITLDCPAPSSSACELAFQQCPFFENCGEGSAQAPYPDCTCQPYSPIAIDVAGNGFDLTDGTNGVGFDINGDGAAEHLAWTRSGSDDAWLTLDRNGNGTVNNGLELFGTFTLQPPSANKNGFLALAEFDSPENGGNGDGRIGPRDTIFSSLRLWQDVNHNGISEPGELHTLLSLDVVAIDLDYKESRHRDQHGNQFKYRAKVYDGRGASVGRWAWDVFLVPAP